MATVASECRSFRLFDFSGPGLARARRRVCGNNIAAAGVWAALAQAGLKANRQRVFDDFIAVGEDLVKRRVTAPRHLAIAGIEWRALGGAR